jgi:hypothetical protein
MSTEDDDLEVVVKKTPPTKKRCVLCGTRFNGS